MPDDKLGLDDAYAVQTPDDNRALYRDWAATYESDFAEAHGYVYHEEVVRVFHEAAVAAALTGEPSILDVGCGTGIVAEALQRRGFTTIDGIDISPEMLAEAERKQVYRSLTEVDVTQPIAIETASYMGVVSAGTFTHGHLGPEPIRELVRLGAAGSVFALGINAEHFQSAGFEALLNELMADRTIEGLSLVDIAMYENGQGDHADDRAFVAQFRVLASG